MEPTKIFENSGPIIHEMLKEARLSADSVENQKANVQKYTSFENAYFAYVRVGTSGGPNGFYSSLEEAYKISLEYILKHLSQTSAGTRSLLYITDPNDNIVMQGQPKDNGKMHMTIYNGQSTNITVNIKNELKQTFEETMNTQINNIPAITENAPIETILEAVTMEEAMSAEQAPFEANEQAESIKANARIFIDANILTQDNIDFLCLTKEQAKLIADAVQNTAFIHKDADAALFAAAIKKVSRNMIKADNKLASGKPTDNDHCSLHHDNLYCATHCKSFEVLFEEGKNWRKVPGKIAYTKLSAAIMDMYHTGQKLILDNKRVTKAQASVQVSPIPVVQKSIQDLSLAITATVMTYSHTSPDMQYFLSARGMNIADDVSQLSNDVLTANINDSIITVGLKNGHLININSAEYDSDDSLRDIIWNAVLRLIISATVSSTTRDQIAAVVDLASVEDFVINNTISNSCTYKYAA